MKLILPIVVGLVAASSLSVAQLSTLSPEQQVEQVSLQILHASNKHDVKTLDRHVADDALLSNPKGKVTTKAQAIEMLSGPPANRRDLNRVKNMRVVEVKVQENTAMVTGRIFISKSLDEKAGNSLLAFTHVFAKRDNEWTLVASSLNSKD